MGIATQQGNRTALKSELYKLLWVLDQDGPMASPGSIFDPAEDEGICDDDLVLLVDTYRTERDRQVAEIKRAFHVMESDLLALAVRNQANRGVLGFHVSDLDDKTNADLGFGVYPNEIVPKYCRLLGWSITKEFLNCSDCRGPYIENLWVPPLQGAN